MNTTTVTDTLNTLNKEGYVLDFNLKSDCVECKSLNLQLYPADFIIDKFFRFEGASNPDDSSIVYAISSKDGLKGTLIDAYGVYADSLTTEMINKLKFKR
ncbi:phosphoribosylpyrophosphate synthetase [Flavihumibacter sp. UBA7668]|uniref:phosphoribosylpyrophosphate synthetase n=1 Tax=Flavihumibacter sp. UBA7668 TaxID=1946542 RepID=UPI0025C6D793|nr:phosphoribosylpyrophosphate synthetase [Flavihumibacter sp. UBA7668]